MWSHLGLCLNRELLISDSLFCRIVVLLRRRFSIVSDFSWCEDLSEPAALSTPEQWRRWWQWRTTVRTNNESVTAYTALKDVRQILLNINFWQGLGFLETLREPIEGERGFAIHESWLRKWIRRHFTNTFISLVWNEGWRTQILDYLKIFWYGQLIFCTSVQSSEKETGKTLVTLFIKSLNWQASQILIQLGLGNNAKNILNFQYEAYPDIKYNIEFLECPVVGEGTVRFGYDITRTL